MTKIGLTLFVVFAFGAIAVAPALAYEGPDWWIGESQVTGSVNVETKEVLTLTDLKVPILGEAAVKCEATLDGTVKSEGKDETTAILNTKGEEVSKTKL